MDFHTKDASPCLEKTHGEEGIIQPRRARKDPLLGPDAVLVMIREDLEGLVKRRFSGKMSCFDMHVFTLYREKGGNGLSLSGPFLGAPQAVMAAEKIIALGAKRLWVLGWCGSLQPDLRIGDIVIPEGALAEEGTSSHYPIGGRAPRTDEQLNKCIEEALQGRKRPFRKGTVWTTDAPYREVPGKVTAYGARGVLAVEMEMSALMTVALFRGVGLAGLLVVSDELHELRWRHGFGDPRLKEGCRLAGDVLVEMAASLGQ
ncbi:MAG: nucleoside phosphorylase [Deltaproteobacteria bacterium]|nr:nucleoside phosphorylase [Deltaproteobacteria bacterium]